MEFLDTWPSYGVVGSWVDYVRDGKVLFRGTPPTEHADLVRFLYARNGIEHPSAMIRTRAIPPGGYDERYCGAEDYDLWFRIARHHKLANLPTVYVLKEITPTQVTARAFRPHALRVQWRHFDGSRAAVAGLVRSLVGFVLPRPLIHRARHIARALRRRAA